MCWSIEYHPYLHCAPICTTRCVSARGESGFVHFRYALSILNLQVPLIVMSLKAGTTNSTRFRKSEHLVLLWMQCRKSHLFKKRDQIFSWFLSRMDRRTCMNLNTLMRQHQGILVVLLKTHGLTWFLHWSVLNKVHIQYISIYYISVWPVFKFECQHIQ